MAPASLVASPPGNLAETFWQFTVELVPLQAMSEATLARRVRPAALL